MQNPSSTGSTQNPQRHNLMSAYAQMAAPQTDIQQPAPQRRADVQRAQDQLVKRIKQAKSGRELAQQMNDASAGIVQHGPRPAARKHTTFVPN